MKIEERAVNEGMTRYATSISNPIKLLIPAKKKLWHKVDPKLAIFNQGKNLAHL